MSTNSFFKKKLPFVFAITTVILSVLYAFSIAFAKKVALGASFYFLLAEDTRVEAGAEFVKLEGGAGYLLEAEGRTYVALSVYLNENEGREVQAGLTGVRLLRKEIPALYFKGVQKGKERLWVDALKLFYGYMSVLEECINRLEKGMTQEQCKATLFILKEQFDYAQNAYAGFNEFADDCGQSSKALERLCEEIVYTKDLRYLLCWQAEKYVKLCNRFAL